MNFTKPTTKGNTMATPIIPTEQLELQISLVVNSGHITELDNTLNFNKR